MSDKDIINDMYGKDKSKPHVHCSLCNDTGIIHSPATGPPHYYSEGEQGAATCSCNRGIEREAER